MMRTTGIASVRTVAGDLTAVARRLLLSRLLRSVCQGALVVDFALYLARLHWSGAGIGAVVAASFIIGSFLSLIVGPLSDRFGYRRLLVAYEAAMAGAFLAAALSVNLWILSAATIFGGFGRGANGAPGCFVPAELAWLAEVVPASRRPAVYSLNTALGFAGMGCGAVLAAGPYWWADWLPGDAAYRPLFWLGAAIASGNALLLSGLGESAARRKRAAPGAMSRRDLSADERRALIKLGVINLFNGLSVGLSGPLIAYWFAEKFRVGPQQIGLVVAAAFISTALCATAMARIAGPLNSVRSYVRLQWAALLLLLILPLAGDFRSAALLWVLKFTLERGGAGAMEAVSVSLVSPQRWGLASGLGVATLAMPRSIGPMMTGHWISVGTFATPLVLAACLQAIYIAGYQRAFSRRQSIATAPIR